MSLRERKRRKEGGSSKLVPYALAIISVSLKPTTTPRQKIIKIQFISGM